MPLLEDIADYLTTHGVVTAPWTLYIGTFPDDQDQVIGLFATGGEPFDTLGRENVRPTFQTRVRAAASDYGVGYAKWKQIFDTLQDAIPTSAYAYVQATATGPLAFSDDKERPNFTSNWRVLMSRNG
jgi:hypothetical protein